MKYQTCKVCGYILYEGRDRHCPRHPKAGSFELDCNLDRDLPLDKLPPNFGVIHYSFISGAYPAFSPQAIKKYFNECWNSQLRVVNHPES